MAEVDVYKICVEHPDDWQFVRSLTHDAPANVLPALFCAYLSTWRHAAMQEPASHRKENAGRRAANTRLRLDAIAMEGGDKDTRQRYARLVQYGPKQNCATCQHCSLIGECKRSLPGPGHLCEEWRADFC